MRHIKSIISARIKALNNKTIKNKEQVNADVISRKLVEIIKQKSTEHVEVLFCKNKEVYIKCNKSSLANELYLMQEEIKNEINKFFDKEVVKKFIFKV